VLLHSKLKEHTQIVAGEKKTVKKIKQNGAKLDTAGFTRFPQEVRLDPTIGPTVDALSGGYCWFAL